MKILTSLILMSQFFFNLQEPLTFTGPGFNKTFDSAILDTPSNTPTTAYSIPVDVLHVCYIEIFATAVDFSNGTINAGAAGNVVGLCGRGSGNVGVVASSANLLLNSLGTPGPTLALVANTTTQNIDVVVTGKSGLQLRWNIDITIRMSQ